MEVSLARIEHGYIFGRSTRGKEMSDDLGCSCSVLIESALDGLNVDDAGICPIRIVRVATVCAKCCAAGSHQRAAAAIVQGQSQRFAADQRSQLVEVSRIGTLELEHRLIRVADGSYRHARTAQRHHQRM